MRRKASRRQVVPRFRRDDLPCWEPDLCGHNHEGERGRRWADDLGRVVADEMPVQQRWHAARAARRPSPWVGDAGRSLACHGHFLMGWLCLAQDVRLFGGAVMADVKVKGSLRADVRAGPHRPPADPRPRPPGHPGLGGRRRVPCDQPDVSSGFVGSLRIPTRTSPGTSGLGGLQSGRSGDRAQPAVPSALHSFLLGLSVRPIANGNPMCPVPYRAATRDQVVVYADGNEAATTYPSMQQERARFL